jgi:hypothetical protein
MANQEWVNSFGPWHIADGTAVTASATLTELTPTPQILIPYPALIVPGTRVRFNAWGVYTTTGTQGTLTLGVYMGAANTAIGSLTAIATTGALTWVAAQTTRGWHIAGQVDVRTAAVAGTAVGYLDVTNITSGSSDVAAAVSITSTTSAINTTITNSIALGATISVASQSITCRSFTVEVLN